MDEKEKEKQRAQKRIKRPIFAYKEKKNPFRKLYVST